MRKHALTLRAWLVLLLLAGGAYVAAMSAFITLRIAPAGAMLEQGMPETAGWHDRLSADLVWLEATLRDVERLVRQHAENPGLAAQPLASERLRLKTWLDQNSTSGIPPAGATTGEISRRLIETSVAERDAGHAMLDVVSQLQRGPGEPNWARLDDAQRLNAAATSSLADAGHQLRTEQLRREHAFRQAGWDVVRAVNWWLLLGVALVPLLAWFAVRRLYHPLAQLDRGLARVADGDLDATIEATRDDELGRLAGQFNTMTTLLRHRAEQERQQARRQTERLQEQLIERERLAALGRMAGAIAHEVGAPLNSVLGHAQLLAREELSDRGRRRLGIIESQVQRMVDVIQHYLSRTRDAPTPRERVDVNELARDTLAQVDVLLRRARVKLHMDLIDPAPIVMGDADGLHRVLVNLIQNAIDAMPAGGQLTIATGTAAPPDAPLAGVTIDVIDTGAGIPADAQSKMFDLFFTTKPQGRGTGMGLSICQEIVKMHGGRILVTSEVGQGTCMRVLLPVDAAERSIAVASAAAPIQHQASLPLAPPADAAPTPAPVDVSDEESGHRSRAHVHTHERNEASA